MKKNDVKEYNYVTLETTEGPKAFRTDFLVLATFRPIDKEKMTEDNIIHLDGNTRNDHLDNLMWKSEYDARYTLNRLAEG